MLSKSDIAQNVIKHHEQAVSQRGTLEQHWEEIARRVLPHYSGSFTANSIRTQGEKRTEDMVDATSALALQKFASVMESMLTPRNSKWHRLIPSDPALARNHQVRLWLDAATDILFKHRYSPRANFASQKAESYYSLGAFGTGVMFIDKLDEGGVRYKAPHIGEVYFSENHQGIIDTASRKFELTARQAKQAFGEEALPEKIREACADPAKAETKFWFVHCVKPRTEAEGYDGARKDVKGMAFASYHVSVEAKEIVREGGYNTFPYSISRYVVAPGETYGRSPAMLALPSIKVLNEQKKTVLKQGHRAVDPVLLAHDDGVLDSFSLKPGAVNYGGVSAEGRALVQALPVGNLSLAKEMMAEERHIINDAFLVNLFQILTETPQMTATEVLERTREKGMLLGPTMGRQQSEDLGPMIERELDVLASQGLLPPMPMVLKEAAGEFDIQYDSPLSRAMRAEEATGLLRTVDWLRDYINVSQDPTPLDHINWDAAVPELMDIQAVPTRWVRTKDQVAEVRAERAEKQQTQTMIEAAPALSGAIKNLPPGAVPEG